MLLNGVPFATIPEQYERLEQYIKDQTKIEKPILSQDQIEDINFRLSEKNSKSQKVEVQYFHDGHILSIYGSITKIDNWENTLYIKSHQNIISINLSNIYQID
ncbi:hypothetical protein T686_02749 [Staphylococcus aureus SJUD6056]|uniref:YolD-like family protein n=1 Tax=Staphylococcus sp. UMB10092B TaxID=3046317 RepID=UPI000446391F|nr:hypothetical protein T686_02749 [Staphylococcus aureus SJUD6056]CAC5966951.1 yolD-like family protein [Staphylococcus aureus]